MRSAPPPPSSLPLLSPSPSAINAGTFHEHTSSSSSSLSSSRGETWCGPRPPKDLREGACRQQTAPRRGCHVDGREQKEVPNPTPHRCRWPARGHVGCEVCMGRVVLRDVPPKRHLCSCKDSCMRYPIQAPFQCPTLLFPPSATGTHTHERQACPPSNALRGWPLTGCKNPRRRLNPPSPILSWPQESLALGGESVARGG